MKELEPLNKVEIVETPEIKKQKKFLGQYQLKRGQKYWEINTLTGQIEEAKYNETVVEMRAFQMPHMAVPAIVPCGVRKLVMNEGCIYYPAINKKNALKKYQSDKLKYGIQ